MGESWRWQLRDSEGQWVKMGSRVKWLSRGKWYRGTVTGSPRPNIATVKPEGGGPATNLDVRRISVEGPVSPALPPQPKSDAGIGRPTRTPKAAVVPPVDGTMEVAKGATTVKIQDAQPEMKSPAVQVAEKRALAIKTDTRLAEIYEQSLTLKHEQQRLTYDIHRTSGSVNGKRRYSTGPDQWDRSLDDALTDFQGQSYDRATWERVVAKYQANQAQLDALNTEAGELNTVYLDNGTWTRAFLVTNQGGHVHRSMSCSTCRPTTRFFWLPDYSGADENQIVDDAGERACTVCYPSAPVSTLNKPTKIFSDDERAAAIERAQRAQERAATKTAKDAKALNNPDGSDLLVQNHYSSWKDHLRTEVSARNWYVKNAAELEAKAAPEHIQAEFPTTQASLEKILEALAAKHGKTATEIRAELAPKVAARVKKDAKERAAAEAMWQTELKARGL